MSFYFLDLFTSVYVGECLPACRYVRMCTWCSRKSEEGIWSPATGVVGEPLRAVSHHVGCGNTPGIYTRTSALNCSTVSPAPNLPSSLILWLKLLPTLKKWAISCFKTALGPFPGNKCEDFKTKDHHSTGQIEFDSNSEISIPDYSVVRYSQIHRIP